MQQGRIRYVVAKKKSEMTNFNCNPQCNRQWVVSGTARFVPMLDWNIGGYMVLIYSKDNGIKEPTWPVSIFVILVKHRYLVGITR